MLHKLKPVPRAIIIGIIVAGGVFAFMTVDFSTFKQKAADETVPPAPPAPQVTTVAPPTEHPPAPVASQPAEPVRLESAPVHDAGLANVLGTKN